MTTLTESAVRGSVAPAPPLSLDDLRARTTISVPEAGAVLGLGKNASFRAAQRGEIPTLRLGRSLRVPVPRLLALLGAEPTAEDAEPGASTAPGLASVHVLAKELESSDGAPETAS